MNHSFQVKREAVGFKFSDLGNGEWDKSTLE